MRKIEDHDLEVAGQLTFPALTARSFLKTNDGKSLVAAVDGVDYLPPASPGTLAQAPDGLLSRIAAAMVPTAAAVQTLMDSGPARVNPAQATEGNRAASVAATTGQVIRFVKATPTMYTSAVPAKMLGPLVGATRVHDAAWWAMAKIKRNTISTEQCLLGLVGAGLELCQVYLRGADNCLVLYVKDSAGTILTVASAGALTDTTVPHVVAVGADGERSVVVIDGVATYGTIAGLLAHAWATAAWGAANAAGLNAADVDMYEEEVGVGTLTPRAYQSEYRRLMGKPALRVICEGNSLTSDGRYPTALATLLGTDCLALTNLGEAGRNTGYRMGQFATEGMPAIQSYSETVVVLWEVTNDIYQVGASTARIAVDHLWQWCAMWRAAGCKAVVLNVIDRGDALWTAEMTAKANTANVLIAAEWKDHADGFVNLRAHPAFQDCTDTTYYNGDHVHLNDTGYALVAELVEPEVRRISAWL